MRLTLKEQSECGMFCPGWQKWHGTLCPGWQIFAGCFVWGVKKKARDVLSQDVLSGSHLMAIKQLYLPPQANHQVLQTR